MEDSGGRSPTPTLPEHETLREVTPHQAVPGRDATPPLPGAKTPPLPQSGTAEEVFQQASEISTGQSKAMATSSPRGQRTATRSEGHAQTWRSLPSVVSWASLRATIAPSPPAASSGVQAAAHRRGYVDFYDSPLGNFEELRRPSASQHSGGKLVARKQALPVLPHIENKEELQSTGGALALHRLDTRGAVSLDCTPQEPSSGESAGFSLQVALDNSGTCSIKMSQCVPSWMQKIDSARDEQGNPLFRKIKPPQPPQAPPRKRTCSSAAQADIQAQKLARTEGETCGDKSKGVALNQDGAKGKTEENDVAPPAASVSWSVVSLCGFSPVAEVAFVCCKLCAVNPLHGCLWTAHTKWYPGDNRKALAPALVGESWLIALQG